jgi:fructosamine-3-kinase
MSEPGDREAELQEKLELSGPPLPAAFLEASGVTPTTGAARHTRRPLYHLYHALNHLNLFGDSYAGMVRGCLAEMGVR